MTFSSMIPAFGDTVVDRLAALAIVAIHWLTPEPQVTGDHFPDLQAAKATFDPENLARLA